MQIVMNTKVLGVPGKDGINNLCGPVFLLLCLLTYLRFLML